MKATLLDAAFRYKKAGLWKKLWDSEMFAIRLSNGEIGYISIMGHNGEYCALALYIGNNGIQSFRRMMEADPFAREFEMHETLMQQQCLQMALEGKNNLHPDDLEEVRAFAKNAGKRLSGKNAFPNFLKYDKNRYPWHITEEEDMKLLTEALEAAILLAEKLKSNSPDELNIFDVNGSSSFVPLFEIEDGSLISREFADMPQWEEPVFETVRARNELAIASVKKLKPHGIWEADLIVLNSAVQDDPEEAPYFPYMMFFVESETGFLLPLEPFKDWDEGAQGFLDSYAKALKEHDMRPEEIRCRNERTCAILADISKKTGTKINVYHGEMAELDEAEFAFLDRFGGEDEEDIQEMVLGFVEFVSGMSQREFDSMPEDFKVDLMKLIDDGILPIDVEKKLKKLLKY